MAAGDDLGLGRLADDASDRVGVSREGVNVGLGPHVPDARRRVPARGHQDVDGRVQRQRIHGAQVAVVMADNLVVLQIPAFHLPVFPTAEQIRMPTTHH